MILTTVTLRIFFYGLVAFTPEKFSCGGPMRALLIDARHPPIASDDCQMHPHTPALFFENRLCQDPCRPDRGLCRCDLADGYLLDVTKETGQRLCWEADLAAHPNHSSGLATGNSASKFSPSSCTDEQDKHYAYIPQMSSLRPRWQSKKTLLTTECNRSCPSTWNSMCRLVATQINFTPNDMRSCSLSERELSFTPAYGSNFHRPQKQKTAEVTVFAVPIQTSDTQRVLLNIVSFDRGEAFEVAIPTFTLNAQLYADVVAANYMEEADHHNSYWRCGNNFYARDFELLQDLARAPHDPADRPVPQAKEVNDKKVNDKNSEVPWKQPTLCRRSRVLQILNSEILRAGKTRPICPGVTLEAEEATP